MEHSKRTLTAAAACFFLSGAAGLLYEVAWTRLLGVLFGHTVHAITTVLAVFMGGLALGSLVAGRRADRTARPLRAYAALEAGTAAYCAVTPLLLSAAEPVYLAVSRALQPSPLGGAAIQAVFAAAVLVPATALMGATLPVLARGAAAWSGAVGSSVARLYAVNTAGAILGTAGAGFVLLPRIGVRATIALGVAMNLAAAALAWALDRGAPRLDLAPAHRPALDGDAGPSLPRSAGAMVLVSSAVAGAGAMAYEIAWTRALGLVLGSSTYAFSAMLTTFLVGLAAGAAVVARVLVRRRAGLAGLGVLLAAAGLASAALLPAVGLLPGALLAFRARFGLSHAATFAVQFGAAFSVMLVPTLLLGAAFPWAIALAARRSSGVARAVGGVYGANTLGTIAGAITAGFLLVPVLGIEGTVLAAAGAHVLAGVATIAASPGRRLARATTAAAMAAGFGLVAVAAPRWDRAVMSAGVSVYTANFLASPDPVAALRAAREPVFYAEGLSTTVSVARVEGEYLLAVDGKVDASNGVDMPTQLLLAHVPALLRPQARRVLVVGLASGVTAGALAQHPLEAIDVAELEPAMREASAFFEAENRGVLRDPRVRLVIGDGRHVLAAARAPYDLVVSEPSNPWIAGVASLFTVDFYRLVRSRLAPGGLMVQWLQAYELTPRDVRMVIRSFREVFADATLWRAGRGDFLLVGGTGPVEIDDAAIRRRLSESSGVREDLGSVALRSPAGFRALLGLDAQDLAGVVGDAPLNTDDLTLLEFSAPLAMYDLDHLKENERLVRTARTTAPDPRAYEDRLEAAWVLWSLGYVFEARAEVQDLNVSRMTPEAAIDRAHLLVALGLPGLGADAVERLRAAHPDDPRLVRWDRALRAIRTHHLEGRLVRVASLWGLRTAARRREALAEALSAMAADTGEAALAEIAREALAPAPR